MDRKLVAKGMLLGMMSLGIIIDKLDETALYISVPSATTDDRHALAGKQLAERIKGTLVEMGCADIVVKYKIRDEVWTKEKADLVLR